MMAAENLASSPSTNAVEFPWTAKDMHVCLIGYHGAMFEVATALVEGGFDIACVVSHIDDSAGKEGPEAFLASQGLFRNIEEIASAAEAPLMRLDNPNAPEAIRQIRDTGANTVLSVSAPVLKPDFLDAFGGWTFNFHGSRRYRGRGGLSWVILKGITDDAVVLHWMDRGIDTGDRVADEPFSWSQDAYPIDLFRTQRTAFKTLTQRWLDMVRAGGIAKTPQDPDRPYLPALNTDEDGWIDWSRPPEEVERVVRAFGWPYAGASSRIEGAGHDDEARLRIARCSVRDRSASATDTFSDGSVLACDPQRGIDVVCGGGVLRIETLREGPDEVPVGENIRAGMRMRNRE